MWNTMILQNINLCLSVYTEIFVTKVGCRIACNRTKSTSGWLIRKLWSCCIECKSQLFLQKCLTIRENACFARVSFWNVEYYISNSIICYTNITFVFEINSFMVAEFNYALSNIISHWLLSNVEAKKNKAWFTNYFLIFFYLETKLTMAQLYEALLTLSRC